MKIIAILDNKTEVTGLAAKHGLSLYIEQEDRKILFDLGPDSSFINNANMLGIDIASVDTVIISHGHGDHGGGLKAFLEHNTKAKIYIRQSAFDRYYYNLLGIKSYIGLQPHLLDVQRMIFTETNHVIGDGLTLFSISAGQNKQSFWPSLNSQLMRKDERTYTEDDFRHEQNLLIKQGEQYILIGGCAHNGIVRILNKAEQLCQSSIDVVISGFHLQDSLKIDSLNAINFLAGELKKKKTIYHTCHCTGMKPYKQLKKIMGEQINYLFGGKVLEI